jgi:DNA-binding transcriptional LysR family regulator
VKQPDLNLLIYLDLLIKHGSVTRVAQEMGVSQPGVSAALRRLRAVLQDPVLVRTGGGMVPTAKARAVQAQVAGALGLWARLADGDMVFDPARTTRSYSLLASDYIQFLLLPGLAREMARQAPQATLRVIPPNPYRRLQMLVEREADFAIGYYHEAPEELRTRRLFIEPVMCVMRRGHPDAACFDLEAFVRSSHVGVASVSQGSYSATLERVLAERGIQRRLPMILPSYLAVPHLLLETDHVATLPASLATAFARQLPLQVVPSPIALPALDVSILYHDSQQDDAAHQWFRQLVVEVVSASGLARTVDQEPPMPAPH